MSKNIILESLSSKRVLHEKYSLTKQLNDKYQFSDFHMKLLSSSTKSIVWLVTEKLKNNSFIVKKFFDTEDYNNEYSAYLLFRGGNIPGLIDLDIKNRILYLEYIDKENFRKDIFFFEKALECYAKNHQYAINNLKKAFSNPDIKICEEDKFHYLAMYDTSLEMSPISIGDIKEDHLFFSNGRFFIIDLETYSLCRSEWYDVIKLWEFFFSSSGFYMDIVTVIKKYLFYREISEDLTNIDEIVIYINKKYPSIVRES